MCKLFKYFQSHNANKTVKTHSNERATTITRYIVHDSKPQQVLFFLILFAHIYVPITRKQIVLLSCGRDVRIRLGVAVTEISGPPVFHIKVEASVKWLTQRHNKRTYRLYIFVLEKICLWYANTLIQ